MKKINDSRLYLYSAVVTLAVAFILGAISYYSILVVEPDVGRLLSAKENFDKNYKEAYLILRNPQLFAGYSNFDTDRVKNSLTFFDGKVSSGEKIDPDNKMYLEVLLDRRKEGSALGKNTMIYLLLLSLIAWILYFFERKTSQN
jgi:hypothetical protein